MHRGVEYERAMRSTTASSEATRRPSRCWKIPTICAFAETLQDPITGKDFKVLHQVDVMMAFGNAIGGGGIAGGQTLGQPVTSTPNAPPTPAATTDSNANPSDSREPRQKRAFRRGRIPRRIRTTPCPSPLCRGQPAGSQTMGGRHCRGGERQHRSRAFASITRKITTTTGCLPTIRRATAEAFPKDHTIRRKRSRIKCRCRDCRERHEWPEWNQRPERNEDQPFGQNGPGMNSGGRPKQHGAIQKVAAPSSRLPARSSIQFLDTIAAVGALILRPRPSTAHF